jgi:hypothetical protein
MLSGPSEPPPWPLRRLAAPFAAPAQARFAALAADVIIVTTDTAVHVYDGGAEAQSRRAWPLDWPLGAVGLSALGRFALLISARCNRADVVDLRAGELTVSIGELDARPHSVMAAFSFARGEERLVLSRERFVLEALALPTRQPRFKAKFVVPQAFVFDSLHPMLDGNTLVAIGHGESESKDSLATLSLSMLSDDPATAVKEAGRQAGASDYAYRLAAGPAGRDAMVAFRDPEEDEEPDDDSPTPTGDLENFRGLYVRRLADRRLVERVARDLPIESGAPIYATDQVIAVGGPGRIDLVPRAAVGAVPSVTLDAGVYAFDSLARRIMIVRDDGMIDLFQLRGGEQPFGGRGAGRADP